MPTRRSILATLLLVVSLSSVLGGCDAKTSPERQAAVEAVWDQYVRATAEAFVDESDQLTFDPDWVHLQRVKAYKDIDVSRCPAGFRAAWDGYLVEYTKHDPSPQVDPESGAATRESIEEWGESMRPLQEAEQKLMEAFARYSEKVAMEIARAREARMQSQ